MLEWQKQPLAPTTDAEVNAANEKWLRDLNSSVPANAETAEWLESQKALARRQLDEAKELRNVVQAEMDRGAELKREAERLESEQHYSPSCNCRQCCEARVRRESLSQPTQRNLNSIGYWFGLAKK